MSAPFVAMCAGIMLTCVGQLCMKAAQRDASRRGRLGGLLHPLMVLGLMVMCCVMLLASYALGHISLATFAAWNGANYPLTVCGAALVLKEPLTPRMIAGVACVCVGILIFSL